MRVLITGASGFIGRALGLFLNRLGYQVVCAVRNDKSWEFSSRFECVNVGEINQSTNWEQALEGVDVIVHLAACVHQLTRSTKRLGSLFDEVNVAGTQALVSQAKRTAVKRIIFLSSTKVFGERADDKVILNEASLTGINCDAYGLSKLLAEKQLQLELEHSVMDFVIIRPPLVYGPQVKANFASLLGLLNTRSPLPFARVNNYRSMVAIDNLLNFIACCIASERAKNQIYLISDDDDVSLSRLVFLTRDAMHVSQRLFFLPMMVLKLMAVLVGRKQPLEKLTGSFRVSCQKAKQQLGWRPVISVEHAIIKTVDDYLRRP